MLNFILCRFSWLPPLIICCLPPSLPFFCIEDICGSWNSNITCERTFPKMTKRYTKITCVCVNMFLKSWENLEQCMYPIHWAPPLSLSSLEFTLVVHLARGRDGVVAPKILERQTKMGKSFGNHGKSMKSCEYL